MENISSSSHQDQQSAPAADAKSAIGDTKRQARHTTSKVADQASGYADHAKEAAADEVQSVAAALRTAAKELRDGSPQARTFSQIAETLADASDSLRDKDLGQVLNAANSFARRNPLVFLSSAALVGFAATRFAKASTSGRGQAGRFRDGYGSSTAGSDRSIDRRADTVEAPPTTATYGGSSS